MQTKADNFEILYTMALSSDIEFSEIRTLFEIAQKHPNASLSTTRYSDETVVVAYLGQVSSEELEKEIEEYFED